ncbi:MAG: hypothetical protein JWO48_2029 [Bryobacterales bacterium]|nr:hypothetical protein [Bryobacterales bacterium]
MVNSVSAAVPTQPAAANATDSKKAPAPKQKSSADADTDTVHISSAAQAKLSTAQAALQEAAETPAQTAKEASGGDGQAQRLLARETQAAAYSVGKPGK